jgi:hypothetical protein
MMRKSQTVTPFIRWVKGERASLEGPLLRRCSHGQSARPRENDCEAIGGSGGWKKIDQGGAGENDSESRINQTASNKKRINFGEKMWGEGEFLVR